jgi:hypothetical protein
MHALRCAGSESSSSSSLGISWFLREIDMGLSGLLQLGELNLECLDLLLQ